MIMSKVNFSPNRLRLAFALSGITMLLPACKTEEPIAFSRSENVFAEVDNWYVNPTWSANASAHGGASISHPLAKMV